MDREAVWLRGVGVILVSSVLFGVMAVLVNVAAREMSSIQIAFVRFVGSFAVLLACARGTRLRPRRGNLPRLLQRGLLGSSAIIFYYLGIERAGAGLATLLNCTYPVPTAVFAVTLMGERVSGRLFAAIALNLLGIAIVIGPGANLSHATTIGATSALIASVLAGGAVATARHLRASEDALLITIYFMAVGAVLTSPSLLLAAPPPSLSLVMALAGIVITSAAGQWLLHHGLGYASATQGSLACAASVVTAAVLDAVVLGERLGMHTLLGAGFMLAAVGLAAGGLAVRGPAVDAG